jgi:predicted RNA-binding Zn-ribbon protein involved in translation (DUF1610 family)
VGEAFGHLPKKDAAAEDADGGSEWFETDQGSDQTPARETTGTPAADQTPVAPASTPADLREVSAAEQPPVAVVSSPADSDSITASPVDTTEAPTPDTDSRVRLRALTGGLADLSDALAAIGVESVALRNSGPVVPPSAPSSAADFRVRCPDCGPQHVAIADVRFVETGDGAEANRYLFTCPACGARVRRPAGPELAEILKSSGVATLALRRGPGQAL